MPQAPLPLGQSDLQGGRNQRGAAQPPHSSSLHPVHSFFNGATQHGFIAHSSISLQAVFRAELFCRTGWSFFAYLVVFNCQAGRTGCLGAPLMQTSLCEETLVPPALQFVQQGPWNGTTRAGGALRPRLSVSSPTQRAGRVFGVKVSSAFTSQPGPAGTGTLPEPPLSEQHPQSAVRCPHPLP